MGGVGGAWWWGWDWGVEAGRGEEVVGWCDGSVGWEWCVGGLVGCGEVVRREGGRNTWLAG